MPLKKQYKKPDAIHSRVVDKETAFALVDFFPESCFLIDTEGLILKSNATFAERFNRSPEECSGLNVFALLSCDCMMPEISELRRKKVMEVLRTGKELTFEDERHERTYRHTIYPLRSSEGDIENLFILAQDITLLKQSELTGLYEKAFSKAVIDAIPGTFYLLDSNVRLVAWNAYLRDEIFGKAESEMAGSNALEFIHPDDRPIIQEKMLRVLNLGVEERVEVRVCRRGGSEIIWRLLTGKKIMLNGTPFLIGMGIDITKRKKAENELQKLNRSLLAISNCNQVLLHAHDESELLHEICRIVVEIGGYRMAWVGYAEQDDAKSVSPVAQAGFEEGYLETLMISLADIERGRGPTGTAIRTGQPCTTNDVLIDPQFLPWLMEAKARGYASVLSLPLKSGNKVFGALTMYSIVQDAFTEEETRLLSSLADNLAYGITMLHTRKAREMAEDALRQSEARYRSIFQNHHTVMLIIDPENGMLVDANPAAVSFYGWNRHELCRMNIKQISLIPTQAVKPESPETLKEGSNGSISRHCRADGSIRDVEVFSAPITIKGRSLLYSVVHDVTERILHESLSAFRQHLLQIAESHSVGELLRLTIDEAEKRTESSVGFCYFIGENQPQHTLVSSSNVMRMQNNDVHNLFFNPAEIWVDVVREQKAFITNEYSTEENQRKLPDDHPQITRTLVAPVLQGDKVVGIFWVGNKLTAYVDDDIKLVRTIADIAWDIVSRKLAEQSQQEMQSALIQFQKMELMGQLAGGIAHDFNNMLGVIIGNIEIAMDLTPALEESLQYNLKNILKAATRSADLTRQLLTFARKQTVMPLVLELNVMVENMLPVLRRLIGENITIHWIPDIQRTLVKIDPSQIDQILANLCVNARDSIAGIGKITIEVGRFCEKKTLIPPLHPCKIHGDYVTLSVTDDGCGIEKEHLPHIFEPFFTTKALGKGSGLGLSTVYGIVKQNNGCINYISEPGKGSTFKIHLPRHRGGYADQDDDEQSSSENISDKETILLVENEHDILVLCKNALEQSGYKILSAATPPDAIRLARRYNGEIALLLTDVVMPEMNGCDLAQQLLSFTPGLKTLFMSGYSNDVISPQQVIGDSINFIQKPFSLKSLTRMVNKILNHADES
ncbi:MAG: GAF domain-containing protein [Chlorobiaceae bacterium]|nr:GAF domain-containing protein [Chlorobiaceae bacterium]NTV15857.1 GAF domain-containing protein [Chlorobiaceae bacterium]